jgi:F-type H+-transporting ATPase subunit delta
MTDIAARRYAAALLDVAAEKGAIDRVLAEVESFVATVRAAPALKEILADPTVPSEATGRAVAAVATRMALSETVRGFLGLLASRRRLGRPEALLVALREERDHRAGRATGVLESAGPIAPAQLVRLREAVGASIRKTLVLTEKRDPAMLGGLRIVVGDRVFDLSARTYLESLRSHLLESR